MDTVKLPATTKTKWQYEKEQMLDICERLMAKQIIDKVLPILPQSKAQPIKYSNGNIDDLTVRSMDSTELVGGIKILLAVDYDIEDREEDDRENLEPYKIAVMVGTIQDVIDQYWVEVPTLEVHGSDCESYRLSGNHHLHQKAKNLVDSALTALQASS
jgi:hypothetical protein